MTRPKPTALDYRIPREAIAKSEREERARIAYERDVRDTVASMSADLIVETIEEVFIDEANERDQRTNMRWRSQYPPPRHWPWLDPAKVVTKLGLDGSDPRVVDWFLDEIVGLSYVDPRLNIEDRRISAFTPLTRELTASFRHRG